MPRMKLTREAQREVIKVRERQALREKRMKAAVDKDWEAFDELLALLDEHAPKTVLEWALAGVEREGKKRPVLITEVASD